MSHENTFEFVGILWSIWLLRNKLIFNPNLKFDPTKVLDILETWKKREERCSSSTKKEVEEGQPTNFPPTKKDYFWSPDWSDVRDSHILLVDGAWKTNSKALRNLGTAAYGWVLQGMHGEVDRGGHIIDARSAEQAEALAIYLSLKEMVKRNIETLDVWTDSKVIVDGLRESNKSLSSIRNILLDIGHISRNFKFIRVLKVDRARTVKAHSIAVKARKELGCNFFLFPIYNVAKKPH